MYFVVDKAIGRLLVLSAAVIAIVTTATALTIVDFGDPAGFWVCGLSGAIGAVLGYGFMRLAAWVSGVIRDTPAE